MSGASFVAMAGGIYFKGYGYMALLVGWTGGYVLVASLLAPYLRKFGCYTVPDFIGTRYGGNLTRFLAVVVLTVASFTYVTAQINANIKGGCMKMLSGFSGTINSLTNVVISLLGLGIVVSLLGGNVPFVGGIADNIVSLVQSLGDAGIVGLIAAIIILGFYK
jgi:Na+(H+)/acetate symporter ActP